MRLRQLALLLITTVVAWLLLPTVAFADNCGSLSDCYNTLRAALAAAVGVGLFAAFLSLGLDFIPGVGTAKGIIEAITGRDLITGQELTWWERVLGIVPVAGAVVGGAAGLSRAARHVDDAGDIARTADRASDVTRATDKTADAADAGGDVSRTGRAADTADDAAGAGRADDVTDAADQMPTRSLDDLPSEAKDTLDNIESGGPFPYKKDGTVFRNKEGRLPNKPEGYYREYTVETPGAPNRAKRRIVTGQNGEVYYTDDHYSSFVRVE